MILGLQTIYNVIIAMVYRIVAGLILTVLKKNPLALIIAGPAGTFAARLVLATILGVAWQPLVVSAAPGMIFTAITAPVLTSILKRVLKTFPKTPTQEHLFNSEIQVFPISRCL